MEEKEHSEQATPKPSPSLLGFLQEIEQSKALSQDASNVSEEESVISPVFSSEPSLPTSPIMPSFSEEVSNSSPALNEVSVQETPAVSPALSLEVSDTVSSPTLPQKESKKILEQGEEDSFGLRQQLIETYQIGEQIAEGGMGYIHDALDIKLQRHVAMKIAKQPKSQEGHEEFARFVTEARTTGILEHPNIMPVHDLGINQQGLYFFTMKKIHGKSLGHKIKELQKKEDPDWTLSEILQIFLKICDAVSFAHSQGVIHRDLKPDNIMLGDYGEVLVLDWGLAKFRSNARRLLSKSKKAVQKSGKSLKNLKVVDSEDTERSKSASPTGLENRTRGSALSPEELEETLGEGRKGYQTLHGMVIGTPEYMPPEQAKGQTEQLDERSDIYALGTILYEMLTLDIPYKGETYEDVLVKVCTEAVLPASEKIRERQKNKKLTGIAHIPPELEAIILTCMEEKQEHRYPSVKRLSKDILRFMTGDAVSVYQDSVPRRVFKWGKKHPVLVGVFSSTLLLGTILFASISFYRNKNNQNEIMMLQQKMKLSDENERAMLLEKERNETLLEKLQLEQSQIKEERQQLHALQPYIEGMEMMERRFYKKASEEFQNSIEANPHFASAYIQLAKCHTNLGFFLSAVENLKKCISILSEKRNEKALVQPYFMLGQIYLNYLNDNETAQQYFKKSKEFDPESPYGRLGQAMSLFEAKNFSQSLQLVNQLLEQENVHFLWEAYYLKGRILSQKMDEQEKPSPFYNVEEAKICYQETLKYNGDLPLVHFELFWIYFAEENYQTALRHIERSIESFPWESKYHYYRAKTLYRLKSYEMALNAVNQAIKELRGKPDSLKIREQEYIYLVLQTQIYYQLENLPKTRSNLKRLEAFKTPEVYLLWGHVYQQEDTDEKALEFYLKTEEYQGAIHYLALQKELGKLDSEALPTLQKRIKNTTNFSFQAQLQSLLKWHAERPEEFENFLEEIQKQFKK